jgi:hypothetical protein
MGMTLRHGVVCGDYCSGLTVAVAVRLQMSALSSFAAGERKYFRVCSACACHEFCHLV